MSNTDSFIDEVNEEVRRDRLYGYLRRYGWIGVLLVLLVVGGAAWNEWRKAQDRAIAQGFGDALVTALALPEDDRAAALAGIDALPEQQAVLDLLVVAEAMAAQDRPAALAALAAIEADAAVPPTYRALAALKRVMIGGADLPAEERQTVLAGLSQPGAPFRPLALEQMAILRIETGDRDGALEILRGLREDADATEALRRRAAQLIVALGETIAPA